MPESTGTTYRPSLSFFRSYFLDFQNFRHRLFFGFSKFSTSADVGGRRRGVGDPKPGAGAKLFRFFFFWIFKIFEIFPIFFFGFSKFSTLVMFGDVGDLKPGDRGKIFRL